MTLQLLRGIERDVPTPAPDGVTTVFTTSQAYKAGTLSVWRNGRKKEPDWDDGFTETSPTTFTMKVPPLAVDVLACEYEAQ